MPEQTQNSTQNSKLITQNLCAGYGKKQVLFDVSLTVKQGEIVLLAGSNGSGKSTLLKAIFGLVPLWEGQVIFNNQIIHNSTLNTHNSKFTTQTSKLITQGVMYIPQKNNLFEDLTVKENLEMAGLMLGKPLFRQRVEQALSIFTTLSSHLHRAPMKLSGGERQLLTLAMASLYQPKMMLVDEPFTGLSPQSLHLVTENLAKLNRESSITLLIVEHRVKECLQIANRVIGLKLGRVFSEAGVNEAFDVNELNAVFV